VYSSKLEVVKGESANIKREMQIVKELFAKVVPKPTTISENASISTIE
jgi:hypothetical protein